MTEYSPTLIHGDCVEEMNRLPPESFRAVITSPPYNLKSTTGNKEKNSTWRNSKLMNQAYDGYSDNLPRPQYIEWQRACLDAMMRLISPQGAIFYNHHWRTQKGLLETPEDIVKGFPLRQIIIWWRRCGLNFNPAFFMPTYEVIYLIAKPKFKLAPKANGMGSVWDIGPDINNPHPASFPVEIPRRCIQAVGAGPILDPFMGSGTTGVAAKIRNVPFTGIEQSATYMDMARNRIAESVCTDMFGD